MRPSILQASKLTSVGTRSIFAAEHDVWRESVRKFCNEVLLPDHERWEADGVVPREVWLAAGEHGLLCIDEGLGDGEEGGVGNGVLESLIVGEEQAYWGVTGPSFSLHSDVIVPYVRSFASDALASEWMGRFRSGEAVAAIAMTEPGAGSDLRGLRTRAVADGDDWVLHGEKVFISNGRVADAVIVAAVTGDIGSRGSDTLSLFLVDANEAEKQGTFVRGPTMPKLGMHATDTCPLFFDGVRVPKSNVLGEVGKGLGMLMQNLPRERLVIATTSIAAALASWERAAAHVRERKIFGGVLGELQSVRHTLAKLRGSLATTQAFVDQCLLQESRGERGIDAEAASIAKAIATETLGRMVDNELQLMGGSGYDSTTAAAKAYTEARVQRIYGGANEVMWELVGRRV